MAVRKKKSTSKKTTRKATRKAAKKVAAAAKPKAKSTRKKPSGRPAKKATAKKSPKKTTKKTMKKKVRKPLAPFPPPPFYMEEDTKKISMIQPIKYWDIEESEAPEPTRELTIQVSNMILAGVHIESASGCMHVMRSTLRRWFVKSEENPQSVFGKFFRVCYVAQCQSEFVAVEDLRKGKQNRNLPYYLERRFPERWAPQKTPQTLEAGDSAQGPKEEPVLAIDHMVESLALLEASGAIPPISGLTEAEVAELEADIIDGPVNGSGGT